MVFFMELGRFLGLARPVGGPGCVRARKSARPCGLTALVCGYAAPFSIPKPAALRACRMDIYL
ncbi:hypothetical protein SGRA_2478 [Saprospira grandis str. Lewin]|uniref:Uncharacterized protein n=1 Tax=Saprospira grandis (strain Lewin) TaxID=984262 RepID=H6L5J0_SAPGL|nr:hypothetical protein SGRA_2478 [Saprospira grandis str. Lewin]